MATTKMKKKQTTKKTDWCICSKIKYIWGLALRIIAVLIILTWIIIIIQQNKERNQELKEYQALEVFAKIDDVGHEQFAAMQEAWNPNNFTWSKEYLEIDNAYHDAKTIEEKFKQAKKMDIFMHSVDNRLHQKGILNLSGDQWRDIRYHEANLLFDTLLLK